MRARVDGYVGAQVLREGSVLFRGCLQTAGGPEAHRLQAATQREDRAGGVRGRKSRVAQAGQLEGHAERRSGDAAFSQKGGRVRRLPRDDRRGERDRGEPKAEDRGVQEPEGRDLGAVLGPEQETVGGHVAGCIVQAA